MEAGRRNARAGLVRAASASARLANVVCRARVVSTESVVCSNSHLPVARQTGSRSAVRTKSVSANSAALRSRDPLSLSFHDCRGTSRNWRVVETSGTRRILAKRLARRRPLSLTSSGSRVALRRAMPPRLGAFRRAKRLKARLRDAPFADIFRGDAEGRTDHDGRDRDPGFAGDDVARRSRRPTQCARTHFRQNAEAFHPDRARGQSFGGAFAL